MTQLTPFPTRLSTTQIQRIKEVHNKTGVGEQTLLRLAVERGLLIVEAQLATEVKVAPISLPARVIEEAKAFKTRSRFEKSAK